MTRRRWSLLVYGVWFLIWVVAELLAAVNRAPWWTLSRTVWDLEGIRGKGQPRAWWQKGFACMVLGGLGVLIAHFGWRFP